MKSFLKNLWLYFKHDGAWSYRSDYGVKIIVDKNGCHSVDLEDPQTKDLLNKRLMEMARMEIVNGRLVIKGGDGEV